MSIIHMRFVDSFEKQKFVISDKNVGKKWAKKRTHNSAIYLSPSWPIYFPFLIACTSMTMPGGPTGWENILEIVFSICIFVCKANDLKLIVIY